MRDKQTKQSKSLHAVNTQIYISLSVYQQDGGKWERDEKKSNKHHNLLNCVAIYILDFGEHMRMHISIHSRR